MCSYGGGSLSSLWWVAYRVIEKKVNLVIIITRENWLECNVYFIWVCMYVVNKAIVSSIKMICLPVSARVHVEKVYWTNVFFVGRNKEDTNWLYLYTCVCVCVCMWETVIIGLFFLKSTCVFYFMILATTCRVPEVDKRTSHVSSLCVLCILVSHW